MCGRSAFPRGLPRQKSINPSLRGTRPRVTRQSRFHKASGSMRLPQSPSLPRNDGILRTPTFGRVIHAERGTSKTQVSFGHSSGGVSVALSDLGAAGLCRSEVGGIDLGCLSAFHEDVKHLATRRTWGQVRESVCCMRFVPLSLFASPLFSRLLSEVLGRARYAGQTRRVGRVAC